jgi:phosphatidylglycerol lysyltransferase
MRKAALQTGHHAVIYKCNAQTALRARLNGWQVLHMSDDAVVNTRTPFNTTGSNFRQLRRKLKSADKKNIVVTKAQSTLPTQRMEALNTAWVAQNAREYGFSMGTFCTDWMSQQIIFLAHQDNKLVGFISFHAGRIDPKTANSRHWTLDLLRVLPDAPTGTAHAMITQALHHAHESGVYAVSLASAPPPKVEQTWLHRVLRPLRNQGLRQFKSCFGPTWKPLYLCAPSRRALIIGGAEVLRAIRSAT